ncbi:hypothetical protein V2J09_002341 [Rumex salicifolius]
MLSSGRLGSNYNGNVGGKRAVVHHDDPPLQSIGDTLHTHAVAGLLGVFAHPHLSSLFLPVPDSRGDLYGDGVQVLKQVATSAICLVIRFFIPLRMSEEEIEMGDKAAHGEDAYALGTDGDGVTRLQDMADGNHHNYDDVRSSIGAVQAV